MIRVSSKTRHHGRDDVVAALLETLAIADELELSDADRETLLPGILNLVSAVHMELEQVQVDGLGLLGRAL